MGELAISLFSVYASARNQLKHIYLRCAPGMIHAPQHFLYFLPLPHGHGAFLPVLGFVLLI